MGPRDTANTSLIGPLSGKCFGDADAHIVSKITSLGLRERERVEKTQTGGGNKRAGSNNRSIIPIFFSVFGNSEGLCRITQQVEYEGGKMSVT